MKWRVKKRGGEEGGGGSRRRGRERAEVTNSTFQSSYHILHVLSELGGAGGGVPITPSNH